MIDYKRPHRYDMDRRMNHVSAQQPSCLCVRGKIFKPWVEYEWKKKKNPKRWANVKCIFACHDAPYVASVDNPLEDHGQCRECLRWSPLRYIWSTLRWYADKYQMLAPQRKDSTLCYTMSRVLEFGSMACRLKKNVERFEEIIYLHYLHEFVRSEKR